MEQGSLFGQALFEEFERHDQRVLLAAIQIDQWTHKVVPVADEAEHGNRQQRWPYQRQHNMPVNLEGVRPVYAGSLLNLLGQGQKELAQEEDVGWSPGEPGAEGHGVVGVDQLQLAPEN